MKTQLKPLTSEEVQQLFAEDRWQDLFRRLEEHFELCRPLLPELVASLSPVEREQFLILFLGGVKLTDGVVH
jgi:hypothetical protein